MDYQRLFVLILSIFVIILTAGLSFLIALLYVIIVAQQKTELYSNSKTAFVLGKRLVNGKVDEEFIARLKCAAKISKDNINTYILGGKISNANISEARAGKNFLVSLGFDGKKIFLEEKSKHTLENLKNFYKLLKVKSEPALLITNRYHMARSLLMAKGFGINAFACPAEEFFVFSIDNIGKIFIEAFYINFYLSGKYFAKLTKNKKILARVS